MSSIEAATASLLEHARLVGEAGSGTRTGPAKTRGAAPTPVAHPMSGVAQEPETARRLCVICSKGTLDMAYPALMLANAALMEGVEVDIFFTFWGLDMITKKRMARLKVTPVGNTAMHLPQAIGPLPGVTTMTTHRIKREVARLGLPEIPEFLETIIRAGGRLWACRTSADMMYLVDDDVYEEIEGFVDAAEVVEMTRDAQVIFV